MNKINQHGSQGHTSNANQNRNPNQPHSYFAALEVVLLIHAIRIINTHLELFNKVQDNYVLHQVGLICSSKMQFQMFVDDDFTVLSDGRIDLRLISLIDPEWV